MLWVWSLMTYAMNPKDYIQPLCMEMDKVCQELPVYFLVVQKNIV